MLSDPCVDDDHEACDYGRCHCDCHHFQSMEEYRAWERERNREPPMAVQPFSTPQ